MHNFSYFLQMFIITLIPKTTAELTINTMLCQDVTCFYRQEKGILLKIYFPYFKSAKTLKRAGIKNEIFRVSDTLRVTAI